jgi:Spy/CpxP family protein refolding chaperone
MKKTILCAAAAVAALVLFAGPLAAQTAAAKAPADPAEVRAEIDNAIETMRKDARAGKADILGKTMELDSTQAAAFWPIYKQYEAELQTVNNDRLAIIQDFAEHFDSLDDAKAKALLDRQMAYEEKKLALAKKYKDEMLKVLPAKTVARFFQIDSRLNKLAELAVASDIPLVY